MNNRATSIFLVIALVIGAVWLIYYLAPKGHNWYRTFNDDGRHPYDLGLFTELLTQSPEFADPVSLSSYPNEWSEEDFPSPGVVSYFNTLPSSDSLYLAQIDSLVSEGSTALITGINEYGFGWFLRWRTLSADSLSAYEAWERAFYNSFDYGGDSLREQYIADSTIVDGWLVLEFDTIKMRNIRHLQSQAIGNSVFAYRNDTHSYHHNYIEMDVLKEKLPKAEPILADNTDDNKVIAFRLPYGKGHFEYYLDDFFFTNYGLNDPNNFALVNALAAEWPKQGFVYDSFYIPFDYNRQSTDLSSSPLSFILSHPPLRWAWYTALFSLLLFALFRTRRRQRIIPIINPPVNQSLKFAQTAGLLAYQSEGHGELIVEMIQQFEIWSRSKLHNQSGMTAEFRDKLISKNPELRKEIELLFYTHSKAQNGKNINSEELHKTYQIIQYYYEQYRR